MDGGVILRKRKGKFQDNTNRLSLQYIPVEKFRCEDCAHLDRMFGMTFICSAGRLSQVVLDENAPTDKYKRCRGRRFIRATGKSAWQIGADHDEI